MLFCLWSAKGGSGCTVTAAAVGLLAADRGETLLVDLSGDLSLALGTVDAAWSGGSGTFGWGIAGWLIAPCPPADALTRFERSVSSRLWLLPRGEAGPDPGPEAPPPDLVERATVLARHLSADSRTVIVDLGAGLDDPLGRRCRLLAPFLAVADRSVLVTRACYLALSRASRSVERPDAVVLVEEPGRALRASDVAESIGAPVVAAVGWDPAICRSVDAGLLVRRPPRSLRRLQPLLELAGVPR